MQARCGPATRPASPQARLLRSRPKASSAPADAARRLADHLLGASFGDEPADDLRNRAAQ
jgi:hypothetical protein